MTPPRVIWIVGATGLVGRETISALLADPTVERVVAIVRRRLGRTDPRLEERVVDFDRLETELARVGDGSPVDAAVCCLGTTIAVAGSQSAFRRVDHDYVLAFARAAKAAGARQLVVVTALGASARSFSFYNRVKGEVEDALRSMGFEALGIARPSLLLGERAEARLGERLAAPFSRFLPKGLRGIEARTVARALARIVHDGRTGTRIVPSGELQELGA